MCEHLPKGQDIRPLYLAKEWNFCPICGDKVPRKEPRKLWEILSKACENAPLGRAFVSEAQAAVEEFERILDEAEESIPPGSRHSTFQKLKRKVRELL